MDIKECQIIISNIGKIMLGINSLLFLTGFFRNGKTYKKFTLYLISMSVIQFFTYYLWKVKANNIHLSHYYLVTQFILLSLFYYHLFKNKAQKIIVVSILVTVVSVLIIQSYLHPDLLYRFNLLEILCTSLTLVFFSIIHFYNSLSETKQFTYINSGIFIYVLSSTLIFCSGNIMTELDPSINRLVWFMNVVLYLVYQLLITFEWYQNFRKPTNITT